MFESLEQAFQVFVARALVLITNPTGCTWLSFLQSVIPALFGLWLLRVVVLAVRGALFSRHAITNGEAWPRLREAFVTAQERLQGNSAVRRTLNSWRLYSRRVAILPSPDVLICNVGFLRPTILVSQGALDALDDDELQAAILHELAHVMAFDNLKRAVTEASFVLVPVLVWVVGSVQVLSGGDRVLFWLMAIGLTAGAIVRALLLRIVTYWQERQADEKAANALGDRLIVASALVKTGMGLGVRQPAAVSHFSFFFAPTSTRVRRLMSEHTAHSRLRRWSHRSFRLVLFAVMLLGALAAVRASATYAQAWDTRSLLRVAGAASADEPSSVLARGLAMVRQLRISGPPSTAECAEMTRCVIDLDVDCMPNCDWQTLLSGDGVCIISEGNCDEASSMQTSDDERPE